MTNEQIDALRPAFEAWARKKHAYSDGFHIGFNYTHNEYYTPETQTEWSAWIAAHEEMQAARAPTAGVAAAGYAHAGNLANIGDGYAYLYPEQVGEASVPLYTAAQVQAMGRVPPGWQAVPVERTEEMKRAAMELLLDGLDIYVNGHDQIVIETDAPRRIWKAMLAAAPRPPADQDAAS